LAFLESSKRQELFQQKHLKSVYVLINRETCTEGVDELPTANSVTYGWFHFDKYYNGQPTLYWI